MLALEDALPGFPPLQEVREQDGGGEVWWETLTAFRLMEAGKAYTCIIFTAV